MNWYRKAKTESALSERGIWYHGTKGSRLQSILSSGLIPNPKKREWDSDPHAGFTQPSRESLEGVYLTRNLMTAISSSTRNKDRNEAGVIVICEMQPRSLVADEDDLSYIARYPMINDNEWLVAEAYIARALGTNPEYIERARETYVDKLIRDLKELKSVSMHPFQETRMRELASEAWDAGLDRQAAYTFTNNDYDWTQIYFRNCGDTGRERFNNLYDKILASLGDDSEESRHKAYEEAVKRVVPSHPDAATSEGKFAKVMDMMSRTMKKTARPGQSESFMQTARSLTPIGFSGSNRIVGIVEILRDPNPKDYRDYVRLVFGEIPDDFRSQWQKRVGELRMVS